MFLPRPACLAGFATLTLLVVPAHAQSPVVTAAGDPSVDDDTIYSLAAEPEDYPDESSLLLLDDGIVRFEPDGTGSRTLRQVQQALRKDAVDALGELRVRYDASRESFTLNWARVLDRHGRVVAAEPLHVEELDAPVPTAAPVYSEIKIVRISLGGLAEGGLVDWSYTIRTLKPAMPGDFWFPWFVNTGTPVRLSRLLVDVPEGFQPGLWTQNMPAASTESSGHGRRVRSWSFAEVPGFEPELLAADSDGIRERMIVAGHLEWKDVAAWYAGLARDRYEVPDSLRQRLTGLVRDAASLRDSLEAVYRWVAQDIRYVSIALGDGGYQPRLPAEVAESRSGDCKDKATLFIALARLMGLEADPVLVRTAGPIYPDLPSARQFNHMVAAVRLDGEWRYLDLTSPITPFEITPPGLQGHRGLMVVDDSTARIVEIPRAPASENVVLERITGTLDSSGTFRGIVAEQARGPAQLGLRRVFSRHLSPTERERASQMILRGSFENATTDSLELFDGRDLRAPARAADHVVATGVIQRIPAGSLLRIRLPRYVNPAFVERLDRKRPREFPIDGERLWGAVTIRVEMALALPADWTVELPPRRRAESTFGSYEAAYEQTGRQFRVSRTLVGTTTVAPPEALDELVKWLRAIVEEESRSIVLRGGGTD